MILKRGATTEDVRGEALRLRTEFGYELKMDGKGETCQLFHRSYRGEFLLTLEADDSQHASSHATPP